MFGRALLSGVRVSSQRSAPLPSTMKKGMATLITEKPSNFSFVSLFGVLVIVGITVGVGGNAAKDTVEYIEDNDIWQPEDDDD
eukprot:m.5790 g.5790  ORF g.5790 m.5790 type:complete len:83 (+) comp4646_c0_seq1:199-447(+)